MNAYLKLLRYEFKTLLKDPMNSFMFVYPFFMLFMVGFIIPSIFSRSGIDTQSLEYGFAMILIFIIVLAIGGFISGSLLAFSLLENKDEQTIKAIAVTPISVLGYVVFKSIYTFVIGVFGNLVMLLGLQWFFPDAFTFSYNGIIFGIDNVSLIQVVIFSIVSSLLTPTIGALISAIAKNKIEGFALMKSAGIIIFVPALTLLPTFQDWKQYLLGIVPNFWPVKAFINEAFASSNPSDLSFEGYMLIGTLLMLLVATLSIYFFIKRASAERG
jgi:fluoroquinolone transport system permease protein